MHHNREAFLPSKSLPTTTEPSTPALAVICLIGAPKYFLTISTPAFWSSPFTLTASKSCAAYSRAQPPPITTPSSTAALVALSASSTLSS